MNTMLSMVAVVVLSATILAAQIHAGTSDIDCFSMQTLPNAQRCALWYFASRISIGLPAAWQQSPAGPAANTLTGFLSLSDSEASTAVCSALPGLTCDLQGRVVQLRLTGLHGLLSPELAALPAVQILQLLNGTLAGPLPAAWGSWREISTLDLSNNSLSGTLPANWSTMETINTMNLAGNNFVGSMPAAWLTGMTHLHFLSVLGGSFEQQAAGQGPLPRFLLLAPEALPDGRALLDCKQAPSAVSVSTGAPVLRISNAVIQGCSRSGIYALNGTFILDGVDLSHNAGASGGGAFISVHACIRSMRNCTVTGNEASTGAGLFFSSTKECRTDITATTISRNTASGLGAGLYLEGANNVTMSNTFLQSNQAGAGGAAVAAVGAVQAFRAAGPTTLMLASSVVEENRAPKGSGGAVMLVGFVRMSATNSSFSHNSALERGGAVSLDTSSSVSMTDCILERNSVGLGGGALHVGAGDTTTGSSTIIATIFLNNSALFGGAIFIEKVNRTCTPPPSPFLTLTNPTFQGNFLSNPAVGYGSALYTDDPSSTSIVCPPTTLTCPAYQPSCTTRLQPLLDPSVISIATSKAPPSLSSTRNFTLALRSNTTSLQAASQQPFSFDLTLRDTLALAQEVLLYPISLQLRVITPAATATLPPNALSFTHNTLKYSNISITFHVGETVELQLTGTYGAYPIWPATLFVDLRSCLRGEVTSDDSLRCLPCPHGTYSFSPANHTCDACPSKAICQGPLMVPRPAFWNSHPFSSQLHPCFVAAACSSSAQSTNRTSLLVQRQAEAMVAAASGSSLVAAFRKLHADPASLGSSSMAAAYMQGLCAAQYQGPVCGSCTKRFGRNLALGCSRCGTNAISWVLYLLSFQPSSTAIAVCVAGLLHSMAFAVAPSQRKDGTPHAATSAHDKRRHTVPAAVLYLLILSTYVQVLALLPLVPMGWGGAARWLFRSLGEVSGVSIGLGNFLDCVLGRLKGWPHSTPAGRTIFVIFVPVVVLLVGLLYRCTLHLLLRKENRLPLAPQLLLLLLTVCHFYYTQVTTALLQIFHCWSLDHPRPSTPYGQYLLAVGRYWSQDTSLRCMKGPHASLARAVGIPGLVVFAAGVPLLHVALLQAARRGRNGGSSLAYHVWYQQYRTPGCAVWELVSLLCRAAFACLAVLLFNGRVVAESPTTHILACAAPLLALVAAATLVRPHPQMRVNAANAAGWLVLLATCGLSILYQQSYVSQKGRFAVTWALVALNIAYVAYLLLMILLDTLGMNRECLYSHPPDDSRPTPAPQQAPARAPPQAALPRSLKPIRVNPAPPPRPSPMSTSLPIAQLPLNLRPISTRTSAASIALHPASSPSASSLSSKDGSPTLPMHPLPSLQALASIDRTGLPTSTTASEPTTPTSSRARSITSPFGPSPTHASMRPATASSSLPAGQIDVHDSAVSLTTAFHSQPSVAASELSGGHSASSELVLPPFSPANNTLGDPFSTITNPAFNSLSSPSTPTAASSPGTSADSETFSLLVGVTMVSNQLHSHTDSAAASPVPASSPRSPNRTAAAAASSRLSRTTKGEVLAPRSRLPAPSVGDATPAGSQLSPSASVMTSQSSLASEAMADHILGTAVTDFSSRTDTSRGMPSK